MAESSGASLSAAEGCSQRLKVRGDRLENPTPGFGVWNPCLLPLSEQAEPDTPGTSDAALPRSSADSQASWNADSAEAFRFFVALTTASTASSCHVQDLLWSAARSSSALMDCRSWSACCC